jgi:hypothetical protein
MRKLIVVAALAVSLPLFATEPNPSARQRELVLKLLEEMNVSQTIAHVSDAIFAQMEKQFLPAESDGKPQQIAEAKETWAAFREKASKIDFAGLMTEAYIRMYSKYFTESELQDMAAFYATPTGKKSIEVLPQLFREGMEAGERELGPKIEQVMTEVMAEQQKKRPWRGTMSDMRSVATALESYAIDHGDDYPAGDYASLKPALTPTYIRELPEKDMWGHPYAYVVSTDRKHYRIVSAGSDTIFDWDSRTINAVKEAGESPTVYRDRLEDDIVFGDGSFLQAPVQAKEQ